MRTGCCRGPAGSVSPQATRCSLNRPATRDVIVEGIQYPAFVRDGAPPDDPGALEIGYSSTALVPDTEMPLVQTEIPFAPKLPHHVHYLIGELNDAVL